jgi:hypothetical protein
MYLLRQTRKLRVEGQWKTKLKKGYVTLKLLHSSGKGGRILLYYSEIILTLHMAGYYQIAMFSAVPRLFITSF